MIRKRYTEEQIISMLKQGEAGARLGDLCRKYGMSEATYYNWKTEYAGLTVSELKRMKGQRFNGGEYGFGPLGQGKLNPACPGMGRLNAVGSAGK